MKIEIKGNLRILTAENGYLTQNTNAVIDSRIYVKSKILLPTENENDYKEVESNEQEQLLRGDGYLPENEVDKVCTSCTQKVTQRQLRLALLTKSITAEMVEGVINQLPEPSRSGALIEFNYASYYDRSNPLINQLGGVFKLSEDDLNEIFNLAGTL